MKTKVVTQEPAFSVEYSDYNVNGSRSVTWEELRKDPVGTQYTVQVSGTCGRDVYDETAKIIYKDDTGVAILFQVDCSTDDPNPREYSKEPELCWYQFA